MSILQPATSVEAETVGWLFLDLNSYFASIEQELRPELRGKPVGVVPVFADTTCCIAASYEAKAFNVRTGTRVADARTMCPGIEFVEARHELYVEYHHKIVDAVESCVPVAVVMSIDEMACKLIGRERVLPNALALASQIKKTIRDRVGSTLRCSIGLAPNRYLSKVASDMQKPDGLVALTLNRLPQALFGLNLMDLPGIGHRTFARLQQQGISTVEQLCRYSKEELIQLWGGIVGEKFWQWLRGDDFNDLFGDQKSVGHSHVLPPEMRNDADSYAVANKLLHKAAIRLRRDRLWAGGLDLTIKYSVPRERAESTHSSGISQSNWHKHLSLLECQDTQTLIEALQKLWSQRPRGPLYQRPFFVGVTLNNLVPEQLHSLDLFSEKKRAQLARTMDSINAKYGSQMLYFGGMHAAKSSAPTRIAFQSIPDLF